MKPQIATNSAQSKRLLDCGVDPNTADMCWIFHNEDGDFRSASYITKNDDGIYWDEDSECEATLSLFTKEFASFDGDLANEEPAWSLEALLALLPKEIYGDDDSMDSYYPSLAKDYPFKVDYSLAYKNAWDNTGKDLFRISDESPIEACVKAIKWLVANGYKLNESKL